MGLFGQGGEVAAATKPRPRKCQQIQLYAPNGSELEDDTFEDISDIRLPGTCGDAFLRFKDDCGDEVITSLHFLITYYEAEEEES